MRYPAERLTVSVLCNTTEADPDALGEKVAAVFLPQLSAPAPAPAPGAAGAPPPAFGFDLATVAGTYVDPSIAEVRVVDLTDGVLRMRYTDPVFRPRELVPAGPGDLLVKGGHAHYRYEPATGTRAAQLVRVSKTEQSRTFVRTAVVDRVDDLAQYAGRFGSDELARDLEIRVEDGHLVQAPLGGAALRTPLLPVARDLFAMEDVGWRFERDARGRIVRLVVSTDRTREVALSRR